VLKCKQEPDAVISLIADEYINPRPIPETIFQLAQDYLAGTLIKSNPAIYAFLQGDKPRFKTDYQLKNNAIVDHNSNIDKLKQIIHAALALDNSYLIIQGPPGTGKSFTAKHIITTLLRQGLKVGITSNSHKAINHLLISTAKHCQEHKINAKFACSKGNPTELAQYQISLIKNDKIKDFIDDACVVATTAWGFARGDLAQEFDYLFVDEAGQVPIANLIATSGAARNLILLGDQMQLPQPIQASHPDNSGVSVLDYLLEQSPIVSGDMGVLLDVSYRMHSNINTFISNFIYAGKLKSHPTNDARVIQFPPHYTGVINKQAGIVYVPVKHTGNTQAAVSEVNQIKLLVNDLLTADLHLPSTNIRKLQLEDMLFVAPYNHQVNKLQTALGETANVGSVDKFQGQEAAVVIISMCTSNAADAPRGIEFLLNKNRLNVAISRAQVLTIIVASDSLTQTHATKIEHLKLLNLFNAVIA
jgi:superfamily I DNA and/or RNA helicase